jgi:MFS family permease
VVGLPAALIVAGLVTIFQLATDDAHRGRIYGAMSALTAVAMLAGTALAGLLADHAGIVPVIAVQGAAHCVAGALVLIALPPTTPAAGPPSCGDSVPPDVGNPALSGAGTL